MRKLLSLASLLLILGVLPALNSSKAQSVAAQLQSTDLAVGASALPVTVGAWNVDFVSHVGGATAAVAVQGDYAYIGEGPRLAILDISAPAFPTMAGKTPPISGVVHGVVVVGAYAFVTASDAGLRVVDVSDPASPTEVGYYETQGSARGVTVAEGYAYVADYSAGLRVLDVSDPVSPIEVGFYDSPGYAQGVALAGRYTYVAASEGGLRVVDVSDPANPTEVGFYDSPGYALSVAVAGEYAYVADEYAGLRVVDISDPTNPTEVGFYDTPWFTWDVAVAGGYAYVADFVGLRMVDVSDPTNPTEVGFYDSPGYALSVAVAGEYAYVADSSAGLRVVDVSDPPNPAEVGFYETLTWVDGVAVDGGYTHVAAREAGLRVIDVSDLGAPFEIGFCNTPGSAKGVTVAGGYAYVADYSAGLRVLDISDPSNPTEVGFYDSPGSALSVAVAGEYAYVAENIAGLWVVDISDPTNPIDVGFYDSPGSALSVAVAGEYAYVADNSAGLRVVDISDPATPTEVGFYDSPGSALSVAVAGEYAYVADNSAGLRVVDISDPVSPTEAGFYDTPGYAEGVAVAGRYAYVADRSSLRVVDVSDPTIPTEVGFYDMPGDAWGVVVAGAYTYIADSEAGLYIVRFTGAAPTYSLSGHVRDANTNPIPGVTVSATGGYSAVTSANGVYTITGLITSTYTLTPSNGGYTFSPPTRTVTVPPDATGQNFVGHPSCDLSKQPVLLVPGWGGSAVDLAADDQLRYFRDWLGADYAKNCNLFYATGLSPEQGTWDNALAIRAALHAAYDTRILLDPAWDGHLDIIGHSYGGINSRAYLESDLYSLDQSYGGKGIHVDNLFTLGTPHGGGTPELPGALLILIRGGHIVDPDQWESLWQLTPWQMHIFNEAHSQPDSVCYRLVGGHAFEQNLPWWLRLSYGPFQFIPNDLGVYRWSAHELASWSDRYPWVLAGSTPDMHGYFDGFGLDQYRSYVYPSDTYDTFIGPYLGSGLGQCVPGSQDWSLLATRAPSPPAVPSVLIASDAAPSGAVVDGSFQVHWGDQSVFYLNWPLGDFDLSLTDPDGNVMDPTIAQTDPNVGYFEFDALARTVSYIFTDTLTGTWGYTITATSVPYTMPYRFVALPSLPVAVTAQASPWQPQGQPAIISSTLAYSLTTPLTDAVVQAFISRPDGTRDTLNLYDDGAHNDQAAGDGIYGNDYAGTDAGGYYAVVVEATGAYQTAPYTRTAEGSFSVATGTATLAGQYSDQPRDTNGDGRYEWLDISVQISVTQVGTYTLAADLVTGDDSYIGHGMFRTGLTDGIHDLTISFAGDDILQSGQDGPYTLTNVLLVDDTRANLLLDRDADVHTTAAYDHNQFGSGVRVYLPIILRNQ